MMNLNLQFFAHKKGMGSTKNGRDSNAIGKFRKRASVHPVEAAEAVEQEA